MINVAILGYGTVGSGVYEVIETNKKLIEQRIGNPINVKYVLDLREFEGDPIQKILVHDFKEILNDKDVDIVVETMGGVNPAYEFTKDALSAGKSVCTSNKELVAAHGAELIKLAKANKASYLFEASVGGGIPIIRNILDCVTADDIDEISGILNGTTNYILTEMEEKGTDFALILKDAQDKGYAERNPEADIEGYDACRKIAILASLISGSQVNYENIHTEGITAITAEDFIYAKAMNASVKLIAKAIRRNGKYYAFVAPMITKLSNPLGTIKGVFNGVLVHGNMLDDAMFYGRGAGKLPTASAVVADVVALAKNVGTHIPIVWDEKEITLGDFKEFKSRFFVRIEDDGMDENIMTEIKDVFGDVLYVRAEGVKGELAFITDPVTEGAFEEMRAKYSGIKSVIRANF